MDQSGPVTIRPFAPDDFEAIVAITAAVFGPVSIDGLIEKVLGRPTPLPLDGVPGGRSADPLCHATRTTRIDVMP